ncbi:MAG: hypothetical protein F4X64_18395 [Chloroflexi bacterium]|nr:hypothetical protein [Chloroflexota bacterium]
MVTKFVLCIDSGDWPEDLVVHKIYRTLPDDDAASFNWIRVIDESEEDYLFPADCFIAIDLPEEVQQAFYATAPLA